VGCEEGKGMGKRYERSSWGRVKGRGEIIAVLAIRTYDLMDPKASVLPTAPHAASCIDVHSAVSCLSAKVIDVYHHLTDACSVQDLISQCCVVRRTTRGLLADYLSAF